MFDVSIDAVQHGFGFLPLLGMAGISALGNWFGGRRQSKMHDASIAANDAIDQRRSQDWRHMVAQQQLMNKQHLDRQQAALNALGGAGIAGFEGLPLGAFALGGGVPLMQRAGGGTMISGTPAAGGGGDGGGMDLLTLALMSGAFGGDPGSGNLSSSAVSGMPGYLPRGPSVVSGSPRSRMGGGNLRI